MIYASLSAEQLVRACSQSGDAEAWHEFVCRFGKLISLTIWRVASRYAENSPTVIEDLVQETYVKVCADNCRLLREFEPQYPGAFFGMLKVTAINVARDHFRARQSNKRGSGRTDFELSEVEAIVPSHSTGPEHMEREIRLQEIDRALRAITPSTPSGERDREIFWLHYRQGLTANEIAEIHSFHLTTKGVESILYRLKNQVRARLVEKDARSGAMPEDISSQKSLFKGEGQP